LKRYPPSVKSLSTRCAWASTNPPFSPLDFLVHQPHILPGCGGKPAVVLIKNRVTHQLTFSEYSAQLREFFPLGFSRSAAAAPTPAFDDQFNRLALSLFTLQFEEVTPYREFCEARKATPENVRHWSQIRAMPVAGFKELELTSVPDRERTRVFHSSGTTGQRTSNHFHSAESLALYQESVLSWFRPNFMEMESADNSTLSWLILTPSAAKAPNSSLVHMFETVTKSRPGDAVFTGYTDLDGTWQLNLKSTLAALNFCADRRLPVAILGTAFTLVHLLFHLEDQKLRFELPPGSRVLETGGYKGRSLALPKPELYARITRHLGIPEHCIVSEYGMCELSSQAYDLQLETSNHKPETIQRRFLFPPWARVQLVSPETGREVADGETGLIRVFDLANVRSVMAVQTEDLGIRRGAGFELLGRAPAAEPRGCSLMSA
jgi:Acyl-protein synthetase, LuxE